MRKIIVAALFLFSIKLSAQVDVNAGMGIGFINSTSLTDYINFNFAQPDERLSNFNAGVEFFSEIDFTISNNWQFGIEYAYQLFSFTSSLSGIGNYELAYNYSKPTGILYYVIKGRGFKLKFGSGFGFRFADITEKTLTTRAKSFSASGWGMLLRGQGHTLLSDNLYVNIGCDLNLDFPGDISSGDNFMYNIVDKENVNLNSFSFVVRVGLSYFF